MVIINQLADGTICNDLSKVRLTREQTKRFVNALRKGSDDKTSKARMAQN